MHERLRSAVDYVQTIYSKVEAPLDYEKYREECEYIVDHRDELSHRIYIVLPGGLSGNEDPQWKKIKEGSKERCSCGNERYILPSNPRTEFVSSPSGEVVVSLINEVYLKPVGGDKVLTYFKLWIEGDALAFMDEPFAPIVMTLDFFSTKGYKLDKLAEALPKQKKPPVMVIPQGGHKIPIFAINAVDLVRGMVIITPDAAVEAFNPDDCVDSHYPAH